MPDRSAPEGSSRADRGGDPHLVLPDDAIDVACSFACICLAAHLRSWCLWRRCALIVPASMWPVVPLLRAMPQQKEATRQHQGFCQELAQQVVQRLHACEATCVESSHRSSAVKKVACVFWGCFYRRGLATSSLVRKAVQCKCCNVQIWI